MGERVFRVLVVEDDHSEAEELQAFLARYAKARGLEVQVSWLRTAIDLIAHEQSYDLILLDIGLPGVSGMEAACLLRASDEITPIVFVTSLAKYAVRGYEVNALGFIVKPVTYSALSLYLDRAVASWRRNAGRYVTISTTSGTRVVPLRRIVYVEVVNHDLIWHLENERPVKARGSLKGAMQQLEGAPVLRISKSHLINMDKVRSIQHGSLTMSSGDKLPLSRAHRRQTVGRLTTYLGSGQ